MTNEYGKPNLDKERYIIKATPTTVDSGYEYEYLRFYRKQGNKLMPCWTDNPKLAKKFLTYGEAKISFNNGGRMPPLAGYRVGIFKTT